jgi:hypothetical protein
MLNLLCAFSYTDKFHYVPSPSAFHHFPPSPTALNFIACLLQTQVISFCIFSYGAGFQIRIHLIRIRIQHFRLNTDPDPDPIRIQGKYDQKLTKNTAEEKFKFFLDQKLQFTYP